MSTLLTSLQIENKASVHDWIYSCTYCSNDDIILFQANIYYRATLLGFTSLTNQKYLLLFSSIFSLMRIQLRLYLPSGRSIYSTFLLLNTQLEKLRNQVNLHKKIQSKSIENKQRKRPFVVDFSFKSSTPFPF